MKCSEATCKKPGGFTLIPLEDTELQSAAKAPSAAPHPTPFEGACPELRWFYPRTCFARSSPTCLSAWLSVSGSPPWSLPCYASLLQNSVRLVDNLKEYNNSPRKHYATVKFYTPKSTQKGAF